jgi:hypothetical protein
VIVLPVMRKPELHAMYHALQACSETRNCPLQAPKKSPCNKPMDDWRLTANGRFLNDRIGCYMGCIHYLHPLGVPGLAAGHQVRLRVLRDQPPHHVTWLGGGTRLMGTACNTRAGSTCP